MAARDDFRAIAKDHSVLTREQYILESTPQKSPDDVKRNLPTHLDYEQDPEKRGTLVLAGPHFGCHRRFDGRCRADRLPRRLDDRGLAIGRC